jgi:hypothetical protein
MLAAISTTILSSRSWAETCSAMVSRSRLNRTRGPPDALRITYDPLPKAGSAGRRAQVELAKTLNFIHSAPPQFTRADRIRRTVAAVVRTSFILPAV